MGDDCNMVDMLKEPDDTGIKAVSLLSKRVRQINVQGRFMEDDKAWPPDHPARFAPSLLVYQCTSGQVITMMRATDSGISDNCRVTKDFEDIVTPLEASKKAWFILIEGVPGVGKSVFLQEIAYGWSEKKLLKSYELVMLLSLRDPNVQQIKTVDDLIQMFCTGHNGEMVSIKACSQYLLNNKGITLTLLIDGYDEYPHHLQRNSLVAFILKREVLPLCGLVVSSRPHASEHLRQNLSIRIDILGFTETARKHYIQQTLQSQPQKIKEITEYLDKHPTIDCRCYIPFNMMILIYLCKVGNSLPDKFTELYHHFICLTISQHLSKLSNNRQNFLTQNINDLTNLPEQCNRIIYHLSKFSLYALNKNRSVFTVDEVITNCSEIAETNGFGLLKVVQHYGPPTTLMTLNFKFVHFAIQEFLAAHYISQLPPAEELKVIKENFWSNAYLNIFSMYTYLTKGRSDAFRKFLSCGDKNTISPKFLEDVVKCLRLYYCFYEADDQCMCDIIEEAKIFHSLFNKDSMNKEIHLMVKNLTSTELECLSLFLSSSLNKEWMSLDLSLCYIQDKGLTTLSRGLQNTTDITIHQLQLINNDLTIYSSSLISELTVKCKVEVLRIDGNDFIGEDQKLYTMLSNPLSSLVELYMDSTKLSSSGTITLFTALRDNNTLKGLHIVDNDINDEACDAITTALAENSCLVVLNMWGNRHISFKALTKIVYCLHVNNTLNILGINFYPKGIQFDTIGTLREYVNDKRESRECQVELVIDLNVSRAKYGDQVIMDPIHAIPPKPENYLSMFVPIDLLDYDDIMYNNFITQFSEM